MYLPIRSQATRAKAWLLAARVVDSLPDHEAHNVVINIEDPLAHSSEDDVVEALVDQYLRNSGRMPLRSVANTIFPEALYRRHGSPTFYKVYLDQIFPRLRRSSSDWGRYFDRLTRYDTATKGTINPLEDLVGKMRDQLASDRTFKNIYEINIYDPVKDAGRVMGRQCLSFLSFKLTQTNQLNLTAVYRNHYYTDRLLGNMIGLGNLMGFLASETGASVGALTIVSTHAQVDCPGTRTGLKALHQSCVNAMSDTAEGLPLSGYEETVSV
jgi:thymidylate synthase